jgi:hypothetical protein
VIKQPPEGLERLKLVSRSIAFNLIWLKALLATSIPRGVNVSSDWQKQRIHDQENHTNNDGLREPDNRESLRWWSEPSERLVGVFSSEIDKGGTEWAGRDGDDETAHLDISANVSNGFGVFNYALLSRLYWN